MTARVVVVGLGPADQDLLNAATLAEIARVPLAQQFIRTRRHPASSVMARATAFDQVYVEADSLDQVYEQIAETVARTALDKGEALYAVPGSPTVAERSVELLQRDARIETSILPAMSFLDLVWTTLAIDPIALGVQLTDGQDFEVRAAGCKGPFVVAQCDTYHVLASVKLAIGDAVDMARSRSGQLNDTSPEAGGEPGCDPEEPAVFVLHHLGLPDQQVDHVAWHELDRVVEPDHLTSLYVPELLAPVAGEVQQLVELVATLRRECPWDREQTHDSLKRHLLEEAYETLDALDHLDPESGTGYEHLQEELGDLLFQIVFHAALAAESGQFTLADVAHTVHDKLRARHPHVFGTVPEGLAPADTASEVAANWEQLKKAEKGRASIFDGIPDALPALLYALKVQKKAASLGELGADLPAPAKWDPVVFAAKRSASAKTIGELLFAVVSLARHAHVDPETALRSAAMRYRDDIKPLEH